MVESYNQKSLKTHSKGTKKIGIGLIRRCQLLRFQIRITLRTSIMKISIP